MVNRSDGSSSAVAVSRLRARSVIQRRSALAGLVATLLSLPLFAATAGNEANSVWNLVLVLFVLLATAGSAALPLSALKHWQGYWKLVAGLPLILLVVWAGWIALSKLLVPASHGLWLLEIFAWAMLTQLYMATVFTAKRQFEKADGGA